MFVEKTKKLKIGDGMDPSVQLGPLTTKKRLNEIEELVETTKKEGAKVLLGGKRPSGFNKGYFYEPTVFDNVKDDYTIMKVEPFGPLTTKKRLNEIEELVETTKKEGAKVLLGGKRPSGFNKGYFYEPTVFDNVKDDYTIMKVEPFGPLVPMLSFKSFDEVIERANNHELGLSSYICTNSMEKAHRASELMETGTVAVNTPLVALAEAPFGGIKQAGYGREGGSMAIKDYLNVKYTHLGLKG